jgi:hypothetical protein
MRMYISIFYVLTIHEQFHEKRIFSIGYAKKTKKCHKITYFSTEFSLLHRLYKKLYFLKTTSWARRT